MACSCCQKFAQMTSEFFPSALPPGRKHSLPSLLSKPVIPIVWDHESEPELVCSETRQDSLLEPRLALADWLCQMQADVSARGWFGTEGLRVTVAMSAIESK